MFWRTTAEELPITEYRKAVGEAMNTGNLYRQGEFKLMSAEEEKEELKQEYARAKAAGKVNG